MNTIHSSGHVFIIGIITFILSGCGSGTSDDQGMDGLNTLVDLLNLNTSEECTNGGVLIKSGKDTNQNDILDEDEVTTSQTVCTGQNGGNGAEGVAGTSGEKGSKGDVGDIGTGGINSLISNSNLPEGDTNCLLGGKAYRFGMDNNSNGILEEVEIVDTQYFCNTSKVAAAKSMEPPLQPGPQYSIATKGGNGRFVSNAKGGKGGGITLELIGSETGHIKLFRTGMADTSYTLPDASQFSLGANPMLVTESVHILQYPEGNHTGTLIGEHHLHATGQNIYQWDGIEDSLVTGLHVLSSSAVLSFAYETNEITLSQDIVNLGAITKDVDQATGHRGDLSITAASYYGGSDSIIDLHKEDNEVQSSAAGGSLAMMLSGVFYNQGYINTRSGLNDYFSMNGGNVTIHARSHALNTGNIFTTSVDSNEALAGGNVEIRSTYGDLYNAGEIDTSGGDAIPFPSLPDGTISGSGGKIDFLIGSNGNIINSGRLISDAGSGGINIALNAGDISLTNYGGKIINAGDISARGGNSLEEHGGQGGSLIIQNLVGKASYVVTRPDFPVGDIHISGNINLTGGNADTSNDGGINDHGGRGGYMGVFLNTAGNPEGQEIILFGYSYFNLSGGDGGSGGNAAELITSNQAGQPGGISGAVLNYVDLTAVGGTGLAGNGGDGGSVEISTLDARDVDVGDWMVAKNFGNLTLNGGAGTIFGGHCGYIFITAYNSAENHGMVEAIGGNGESADGGAGGTFVLSSAETPLNPDVDFLFSKNTGKLTLNGGDGNNAGGQGGAVEIWGYHSVENTGEITSNGGNATGFEGTGGLAAYNLEECGIICEQGVLLIATDGPTVNTGNIVANGGSATTEVITGIEKGGDGAQIYIAGNYTESSGDISVKGGDITSAEAIDLAGAGGSVSIYGYREFSMVSGVFDIGGGSSAVNGSKGRVLIDGENVSVNY